MDQRRYVICDIEATGLDDHKEIIEIALITYQGDKILEIYETLINPLRPVSDYIFDLTSINRKDLETAPKFYEVADAIRMRLENSTFVSHNTDFDYELLKKKFQEMGQELKLKTFCTLKTSQEEIPGLKSYNLDALCGFFHIKNKNRHRAIGDATATLKLFEELLNLTAKNYPKVLFLPQHEKEIKNIPLKAGLLHFKGEDGKILRSISTSNIEKKARELLEVKRENRDLLEKTEHLSFEETGMELIAEFRNLLFYPLRFHWVITSITHTSGEKDFILVPNKKNTDGHWFFSEKRDALSKLRFLKAKLKDEAFAYREGGKSKEEILKHNQKVEALIKDVSFPNPHILILGQGRTLGEKSLVLIRDHHVIGYGYSVESDEEINQNPDKYLTRKFFANAPVDLAAKRYIRVLKNVKNKNESWRSLSEVR